MGLKTIVEQFGNTNTNEDKKSNTFNLPVEVIRYEDNILIGKRLDTKEEIRIKLRPVEVKGENKRIEIEDFANSRHKKHAEAGAIILFDGSYQEQDGVFNSRWANTLHRKKMQSKVLIMYSTVKFVETPQARYVQVKTLKKREFIDNMNSLYTHLVKALEPKTPASRPFAYIRLKDNMGEKKLLSVNPLMVAKKTLDNRDVKAPSTGEESVNAYLSSYQNAQLLEAACNDPEILVEVIYGSNLYLGADSRDRLLSNKTIRGLLEPAYLINPAAPQNDALNYGYKKSVIAIREIDSEDGIVFVSEVKPLINNTPAVSIMDLEF